MNFNSLSYGIFLPIVFLLNWILPHKYRWILLLAGSYYFYMSWEPKYLFLILLTTALSYFSALLLEKQVSQTRRNLILLISSGLCLGILFIFKYWKFFFDTLSQVLLLASIDLDIPALQLLLPVGISFYIFQTLGYVIDVYRGQIRAEHHFGYYATYVSFFPQLVAGPIERAGHLLSQIKKAKVFDYHQATCGIILMTWGYFKKIVVADTLSLYVKTVFDAPQKFDGFAFILATFFFAIQIYCDFSGYSDIAIGTAKLMGIELSVNFRAPYFSQNLKTFWSRWHISLSTFFRDYIYVPFGGSHTTALRCASNILITFLISGLWHGANLTFVVWGGIHGIARIIETFLLKKNSDSGGVTKVLHIAGTFAFVAFAWIFFVSDSLADSAYVIQHMFHGIALPLDYIYMGFRSIGLSKSELFPVCFPIFVLALVDYYSLKHDWADVLFRQKPAIRHAIYFFLICLILFLREPAQSEFIYFQF